METGVSMDNVESFSDFRSQLRDWINSLPGKDTNEFEIQFAWEVPQVIRSSSSSHLLENAVDDLWSIAKHVVLIRDAISRDDFMATTCAEYVRTMFESAWAEHMIKSMDQMTAEILTKSPLDSALEAILRLPTGSGERYEAKTVGRGDDANKSSTGLEIGRACKCIESIPPTEASRPGTKKKKISAQRQDPKLRWG
jgi:hypothetical protein